jgi:hypothetical protein
MIKAFLFGLAAGSAALFFASSAAAQSTGFQGFLQRAGSAVSQSAGTIMGKPVGLSNSDNPSSVAVATTGEYFRPISPSSGGEFRGLYDSWRQGNGWPRASVFFTEYGSRLPCWTARAVIWRSPTSHHEETFQVCNASVTTKDDMGNTSQIGGPGIDSQMGAMLAATRNVQGITHAETASSRNAGPNPPAMPFNVVISGLEGTRIRPMYNAVLIRLIWVSGYLTMGDSQVTTTPGKSLWVAGFDPAGNHDRDLP